MTQQVNFLNVIPKRSKRFTAQQIALSAAVLGALLFFMSLISFFNLLITNHQFAKTSSELHHLQQTYAALAQTYPLLASDNPIVNQVKAMEERFSARKAQIDVLRDILVRRGFSEYMEGVAQSAPKTLWINQMQVKYHPSSVTLSGYATTHHSVSEFMALLSKTAAFSELVFNLFSIKTIKNHPYLRFSIGTATLGPDQIMPVEDPELPGVKLKPESGG